MIGLAFGWKPQEPAAGRRDGEWGYEEAANAALEGYSQEILRSLLGKMQDFLLLQEGLDCYVGLGRVVERPLWLHLSWEGARRAAEYLAFHDLRTLMGEEELPNGQDSLFFPIETELHLLRAIRGADLAEVEDIFRLLAYENWEQRRLDRVMGGHLLNMLRLTIARAIKEGEGEAHMPPSLAKAERMEDLLDFVRGCLPAMARRLEEEDRQQEEGLRDRIVEAVERHYGDSGFCLTALSQILSMGENSLYRAAKPALGMSFNDYLESVRIKKACEFLMEGIAVKDVARMAGYASDISFRRAFKRVMGLAPTHYAKPFIR